MESFSASNYDSVNRRTEIYDFLNGNNFQILNNRSQFNVYRIQGNGLRNIDFRSFDQVVKPEISSLGRLEVEATFECLCCSPVEDPSKTERFNPMLMNNAYLFSTNHSWDCKLESVKYTIPYDGDLSRLCEDLNDCSRNYSRILAPDSTKVKFGVSYVDGRTIVIRSDDNGYVYSKDTPLVLFKHDTLANELVTNNWIVMNDDRSMAWVFTCKLYTKPLFTFNLMSYSQFATIEVLNWKNMELSGYASITTEELGESENIVIPNSALNQESSDVVGIKGFTRVLSGIMEINYVETNSEITRGGFYDFSTGIYSDVPNSGIPKTDFRIECSEYEDSYNGYVLIFSIVSLTSGVYVNYITNYEFYTDCIGTTIPKIEVTNTIADIHSTFKFEDYDDNALIAQYLSKGFSLAVKSPFAVNNSQLAFVGTQTAEITFKSCSVAPSTNVFSIELVDKRGETVSMDILRKIFDRLVLEMDYVFSDVL